jgi:hypothetical protein
MNFFIFSKIKFLFLFFLVSVQFLPVDSKIFSSVTGLISATGLVSSLPALACAQDSSPISRYESMDTDFAKVIIPFDYIIRYYEHHIKQNIIARVSKQDWEQIEKAANVFLDKYYQKEPVFVSDTDTYFKIISNIKDTLFLIKKNIFSKAFNKSDFISLTENIKTQIIQIYEKRRDESDKKYSNSLKNHLKNRDYSLEKSQDLIKSIKERIAFSKTKKGSKVLDILKKQQHILKCLVKIESLINNKDFYNRLDKYIIEIINLEAAIINFKSRGGIERGVFNLRPFKLN